MKTKKLVTDWLADHNNVWASLMDCIHKVLSSRFLFSFSYKMNISTIHFDGTIRWRARGYEHDVAYLPVTLILMEHTYQS